MYIDQLSTSDSPFSMISPAFAITIHKAQGSESSHVVLLYPNNIKDLETSESLNNDYEKKLLYTGMTRAKEKLSIFFAEDTNE